MVGNRLVQFLRHRKSARVKAFYRGAAPWPRAADPVHPLVRHSTSRILATPSDTLSPRILRIIEALAVDLRRLDERIEGLSSEIEELAKRTPGANG